MKQFLAVGINHFKLPGNDLAGCVADAQAMADIAEKLNADGIDILEDAKATKANVMAHLLPLIEGAKAGNLSYLGFSYSAHGTHYSRPSEDDGLGEALVCYDIAEKDGEWDQATIIKDTELHDLLNSIPPTCIAEVWLDTCYSGGMDRVFGRVNRYLHNPANLDCLTRVANNTMTTGLNSNIIMWQACSEAQESADARIPGQGAHGAFTWFWVQAFKANPQNSRVQLLVNTRYKLRNNDYDQFPRLKCWNAAAQMPAGK